MKTWLFCGSMLLHAVGNCGALSVCCFDTGHQVEDRAEPPGSTLSHTSTNRIVGLQAKIDSLFAIIRDEKSSDLAFNESLKNMADLPPAEPLAYWVGLVGDTNLASWRRGACLFECLRRNVPSGTRIERAAAVLAETHWFTKDTVLSAAWFSNLPFHCDVGESAFRLQLPFMKQEYAAVYILVSPEVTVGRFLLLVNGEDVEQYYRIVIKDIKFTPGLHLDAKPK